ncbi:hypothetical protein [Treponema sp. Marseille-Q3903]|jgi:hypothetical protein|uniref:hypothetical protein n=1 Tax=Treponema sp. Marseille-Q3903 TaxID=2766703 RepID=UPI0016526AF4|nr:hypothetical protein [Treponema sp. Marseille-Q3903]MBC6712427.1 hypothetical protein [Treponema sp. Marseille-Q3903]
MNGFENIQISSPDELKKIFLLIAQKEKEGKITQIINENDLFCTKISISEILDKKKNPDFIRYYFQDLIDNNKYLLSVETYHGIGGSLEKLDG